MGHVKNYGLMRLELITCFKLSKGVFGLLGKGRDLDWKMGRAEAMDT